MNIKITRNFVSVCQLSAAHDNLAKRLTELETKIDALTVNQLTFSRSTHNQLKMFLKRCTI